MDHQQAAPPAGTLALTAEADGRDLTLHLAGWLDAATAGEGLRLAGAALKTRPARLIIDAAGLEYCDTSGMGLLVDLCRRQEAAGGQWHVAGLRADFQPLFGVFQPGAWLTAGAPPAPHSHVLEEIGRAAEHIGSDILDQFAFIGELASESLFFLRHPLQLRWRDVFHTMEIAGANALPIIALICTLLGLIMAFQGAIPMRRFGADIFVANLVSLSLLRELGPLMTAIILTARSGSAFAAEIGTMQVNEEVDALRTMGLKPTRFLVFPRVLACVVVTPLLAIFASFFGLIGAAFVMRLFGYPFITFANQALSSVHTSDFLGGLAKAFIFGVLVAMIGCLRGLQTGAGASAVGTATTRAVVSGIVLIAVVDGLLSVVYYYLGI